MRKTGLFIFIVTIAVSCLNEPDCYQLNNDTVVIDFKIIGGGSDVVQLTRIQSPDAQVYFTDTASTVALPLNPKKEETLYILQGTQGDNMLQFAYKRQLQFVSAECGERYYYQELSVLEHDYDSVRVVNTIPAPTPLPSGSKNIEVYRCAITNLMVINFNEERLVEGITSDYAGVILASPGQTLKEFILPLNTGDSTTEYKFDFGDDVKTLRVRYSRTEKTFADVCGNQTLLSDLHINKQVTDLTAVTIANDSIQDLPKKNLDVTP